MKPKPASCSGCPLFELGEGFVPTYGPKDAEILFVGEAPGETEAHTGIPFSGPSGAMLDRLLHKVGLKRHDVRVANALYQCRPPKNKALSFYTEGAVKHCRQYIDPVLAGPHRLVIPLGGSAIRRVMGLPINPKARGGGIKVQDFHGQPIQDTEGRWIVATYHPALVLRKAALMGVVMFDLLRGLKVLKEGYEYDNPELVIDPPIDWFTRWVDDVLATQGTPEEPWLAVDVETEGKDPDEGRVDLGELLTREHRSAHILRVNFACNVNQGVTVVFEGPYVHQIKRLADSDLVKVCHNRRYDIRRMELNDVAMQEPVLDSMDMFHAYQSDVPKGLGFIAPFASKAPTWKHLSSSDPGVYGAMDGVQELRIAYYVAAQLQKAGMWDVYERHMWLFATRCLVPAEKVGLLVDKPGLEVFHKELQRSLGALQAELRALYPKHLRILDPKLGLVSRPDYPDVVEKTMSRSVRLCVTCGSDSRVTAKHRCKDASGKPDKAAKALIVDQVKGVTRYFRRQPLNPDSWQQVLAYVLWRGHKPGKNKAKGDSVDKKTLSRLRHETGDEFYTTLSEYRQTSKVDSTYVVVGINRADANNRLHTQVLERPSTLRLSSVAPNLQNVAAGRDASEGREVATKLANRFRSLVVARPGHWLLEADFSAIEAVLVGWFANDPQYIRMAKLGVHAYLASHILGCPANLKLSDAELGIYFKELKVKEPYIYDVSKRTVHSSNYLMTPHGLVEAYPDIFKTLKQAREVQDLYFTIAPKVRAWQQHVQAQAHKQHFLGGPGQHPFSYKHWFYAVREPRRGKDDTWYEKEGPDAKRAVAEYPQSTARGILTEALLRLHDPAGEHFIGELYQPEAGPATTPFRMPIHDSALCEIADEHEETLRMALYNEMTKPVLQLPMPEEWGMGNFLSFGVEIKRGRNWGPYDKKNPEANPGGMQVIPPVELGVAGDTKVIEDEEDDEEEVVA